MEIAMTTNERIPLPSQRATQDGWYRVKGRTAVGPLPIADLVRVLKACSEGGRTDLVFRSGRITWLDTGEMLERVPFSARARAFMAAEELV
jgi:hypothetical protein